jgi:hypothetical protein
MYSTNTTFSFKNILLFIFFGLSIIMPLGLYMLTMGPTRMIADKAVIAHWSKAHENNIQKIAIIVFGIAVLLLTIILMRYFNKSNPFTKKIIVVISCLCLSSALYVFTFKPELLIRDNPSGDSFEKNNGIEFCFGSYPDQAKMEQLKSEDYTAIVSLLHPLVIPAEPVLMKKEIDNAQKTNIKLISIPMLPWIIENDSAIIKIKQLAKNTKGKYYVHCYLGKDRANVFKAIVEKENSIVSIKNPLGARNIDTIKQFERGKIYKLNNDKYFTPYPTDEEFISFILNGKIKTVVSLMDVKNAEQKKFITREQKMMKLYNMNFKNYSIKLSMKQLSDSINRLPKPLIIHQFSTQSKEAEKFINELKATIK